MNGELADFCAYIMEHQKVKKGIREASKPLAELVLAELYPYIYFSLIFVTLSFILHVAVFGLILRHSSVLEKYHRVAGQL